MSKEYFPHDYFSRNKIKISALIHDYKMKGYGLFWVIVEMLHEDSTNHMELDDFSYKSISKESGCSVEYVKDFIDKGISHYQVFIKHDSKFTTERVLVNIVKREDIRAGKVKAGRASAEARKNSTGVEQTATGVEHNSTKEIKGKEIKGNTIAGITPPSPEMTSADFLLFQSQLIQDAIFIEQLMVARKIPDIVTMMNWIKAFSVHISGEGNLRKDFAEFKRHFKNWITKQDMSKSPPVIPIQLLSSESPLYKRNADLLDKILGTSNAK